MFGLGPDCDMHQFRWYCTRRQRRKYYGDSGRFRGSRRVSVQFCHHFRWRRHDPEQQQRRRSDSCQRRARSCNHQESQRQLYGGNEWGLHDHGRQHGRFRQRSQQRDDHSGRYAARGIELCLGDRQRLVLRRVRSDGDLHAQHVSCSRRKWRRHHADGGSVRGCRGDCDQHRDRFRGRGSQLGQQ